MAIVKIVDNKKLAQVDSKNKIQETNGKYMVKQSCQDWKIIGYMGNSWLGNRKYDDIILQIENTDLKVEKGKCVFKAAGQRCPQNVDMQLYHSEVNHNTKELKTQSQEELGPNLALQNIGTLEQ